MLAITDAHLVKPLIDKGMNSLYSIPNDISISRANDIYIFSKKHEGGIIPIFFGITATPPCLFGMSCMISDFKISDDPFALFLLLILILLCILAGGIYLIYSGIKILHSKTHIYLSANDVLIVESVFEKKSIYTIPSNQPIIFSSEIETYKKRIESNGHSHYETQYQKVLIISNTHLNNQVKPYKFTGTNFHDGTDESIDWLANFFTQINTLILDFPSQSIPQYSDVVPMDLRHSDHDDGQSYDRKKYEHATLDISDVAQEITPVLHHMPSFDDDRYIPVPSEHIALNGRYHNLTKIGDGAQGSMFRALDQNNQPVGIKVYDFQTFQSWKDAELFEREVKTLQSLHFKGIPKYIELIERNPLYYLVESYIPAPSMAKRIKDGERLSFGNALILLTNIAEVLNYLESLTPPVIHRDIKPDNLLIDDEYNVWLVDFGVVADANQKTNAMTFAGTAGYMAPEQLMGKVTPAADIYSAGIAILAYLTGKAPSEMNMNMNNLSIDVNAELPDSIPSWFKQLLLDMTIPSPDKRLSKAASIAAIIQAHIDHSYDHKNNMGYNSSYRNQTTSSYSQYGKR